MTLMQTVYTIALVLGLETVVAASYSLLFSEDADLTLSTLGYLGGILAAILLLAIRFFWVPRNLNSYTASYYEEFGDRVFTRVTTVHFPIALAHALVFYYICAVFVDMTQNISGINSLEMTRWVTRFVLLYGSLLVLNAVWLWRITPRTAGSLRPGVIWAVNNFSFAVLLFTELSIFRALGIHNSIAAVVLILTIVCNSLLDLGKVSKFYIIYDD